ncbi:malectin domain-containing carbohydrate-binding protein [Hymenobacter sp. GOD-10R]|uniref:malectin domain-containing carbohydrate-binding protein n=1 Tax=Hymenobacter sp. GOD-10R TaxID=3093922 RepID=UPI002D79111E|nr:malectin domain-containing carbohydrate-binding protein [Hymenobacter sp. GOD-10R]WRQ31895.1 malectin domain-containing carbohydrate-binding protein [Hymenobacter sp. GOD-10R]
MTTPLSASCARRWPLGRLGLLAGLLGLSLGAQAQLTITSTTPARNTNVAPRGTDVRLTYNQTLNTTTASQVRVFSQQAGGRKAATYAASGSTLTVNPTTDFKPGETVFVTAPATVRSSTGTAATPRVYQFTTQAGVGPGTFGGGTDLTVPGTPVSVTPADIDGDGDLDLLTANQSPGSGTGTVSVRLNNGTGGFSNGPNVSVGSEPVSVVAADVDGDGDLDILTANSLSNFVSVRLNSGGGSFSNAPDVPIGTTANSRCFSVVAADVNADGNLDILAANGGESTVSVRLGNGQGGFSGTTEVNVGSNSINLAAADVTGDGNLDLLTANFTSNTVSVRPGNGMGSFGSGLEVSVGSNPGRLIVADVNGDGNLDLLTANGNITSTVSIRLNSGTGSFSGSDINLGSGNFISSLVVADVDGDGDLDLLTGGISIGFGSGSNPAGTVIVRRNNGGTFGSPSQIVSVGNTPYLAVADVDGDNDLDLLTANSSSNTVSVRLNQAVSLLTFTPASGGPGTRVDITGIGFVSEDGRTPLVTSVFFNGTPAAFFAVLSPTQVATAVPAGATTGPLTVTTTQSTLTSTASFTVLANPVITTTAGATTVSPQTTTPVDPGLTVTDADSPTLVLAQVGITSGLVSSEDVLSFTPTGSITGRYDASSGLLTLNAPSPGATIAQWQAVLRSVSYRNNSAAPLTANRTVSFLVNDGTNNSNVASKTLAAPAPTITRFTPASGAVGTSVTITGTNLTGATVIRFKEVVATSFSVVNATTLTATVPAGATTGPVSVTTPSGTATSTTNFTVVFAPVVTTTAGTTTASEQVATVVDAGLLLTDADSPNLVSATVNISSGLVSNQDALTFTPTAAVTGTYNATTGILALTGTAPVDQYQTVLRSVRYRNSAAAPTTATRIVRFLVNDGTFNSNAATKQVQVQAVNGAPSVPVDVDPAPNSVAENAAAGALVGLTVTATDADSPTLTYALTNSAGGRFAINASTGVVTVANGTLLDYEMATLHTITVQASDGTLTSSASFTIQVTNVNEAPVVANQSFSIPASSPAGTVVGTVVATDPDAGQTLTYAITAGNPSGAFAFVSNQLQVVNATVLTSTGTYALTVQVQDNGSPSLTSTATVTVTVTPITQVLYRLHAGGPALNTSFGAFAADQYFSASRTGANNGPIAGTTDDALYQTERFEGAFGYSLRVPNGTYQVVLHFAELYWTQPGQRIFDVRAENQLVLDNYDILRKVAPFTATTETFSVVVTDGVLNLDLSALASDGGRDAAKLSALEVLAPSSGPNQPPVIANQSFSVAEGSVAGTLVGTVVASDPDAGQTLSYAVTAGNLDGAFAFVGNQLQVANAAAVRTAASPFTLTVRVTDDGNPARSTTATVTVTVTPGMQVFYRLNAGGPALTTTWGPFAADQYFSPSRTGATSGPIAGTTDDALYQTERFEGAFGYSLRVPNGTYQVVLHFAETYWTQPGQRVFDVRAENQLFLDNYDILKKVAPFTATTETFTVVVTDGVLNLDLSALQSDGGQDAAKLSALEVLAPAAAQNRSTLASQALLATARTGKLAARLEAVPNPFAEQVNVSFQLPQAEAYTLTVYDLAGRQLQQQSGPPVAAGERQQLTLALGRYPVGVYVVRLTTTSGTQQVRVVKH